MYFLRYEPLKEKLKEGALTDCETLPYLVLCFACGALNEAILVRIRSYNRFYDLLTALKVVFVVCGIVYAYSRNGGAQGFDFVQKFIVLGWVLTVRFLIATLLLGVCFIVLSKFTDTYVSVEHAVLSPVLTVIYYLHLGKHVEDTA